MRFEQLPSHHTLSQLERDSITSLSNEDLSPRGNGFGHPGDALSPRGNAYHHPVAHMPYRGSHGGVNGKVSKNMAWRVVHLMSFVNAWEGEGVLSAPLNYYHKLLLFFVLFFVQLLELIYG